MLAESAEIAKAKEIIKKMTFNYQPDTFENPGRGHSTVHYQLCPGCKDACVSVINQDQCAICITGDYQCKPFTHSTPGTKFLNCKC